MRLLSQSLLVKAARCEDVARPPVWFMRQAGRYMKEYQAIRRNHTFPEMYKTPEIARDITLQPVQVLGVDAAIL
ncbi:uroporphyrinogen decarboxylase, partial [PVC group bacterium]|nr:uroporphyrinogen decarboxylase [PVC group bacterium]